MQHGQQNVKTNPNTCCSWRSLIAGWVLELAEVSPIRSLIRHPRLYTIFMSRRNVADIHGYPHQVSAIVMSEPVQPLWNSPPWAPLTNWDRRPTRPENGRVVITQLPNGGRLGRYGGESVSIRVLTLAGVEGLHRPNSITKATQVQRRRWGWIQHSRKFRPHSLGVLDQCIKMTV